MCGIAGFLGSSRPGVELDGIAAQMGHQLVHRGPDSGGTFVEELSGLGMAHRRLAILDLSPEGAQPMPSESGRFRVTFNGEIYNHLELREHLARLGHGFRGRSDTEVLLAAVEQWGIGGALTRFNGMFALALWDKSERLLHLARDRMGEKPLYYGWLKETFLFGSELKALRAYPGCNPEIDHDALALFLRHGYIPAPYSIYRGLHKLLPGGLLTISPTRPGKAPMARYWSSREAAARGAEQPFLGTAEEAVADLESLLLDSVKLRMQADVPLGAFLSGGIDSSTVVALMQAQSARPVRTFTIGFHEDTYNEAEEAKKVARHLGTEHTELYLGAKDAFEVIPLLPRIYDEPFADTSQIPTFLVSRLTRRHVTVSLSGDGGDELFCGYGHYAHGETIWRTLRWVPRPLRTFASGLIGAIPEALWRALSIRGTAAARARWRAEVLRQPTFAAIYQRMRSHWSEPTQLVPGASEPPTVITDPTARPSLPTLSDEMMFLDALTYLPDDILAKVDRASMGVSLEVRVPLLDHRVVEMAWRLPLELKRRGRTGKWILRQILHRYVPRELVERPKMGFGVPIDSWLRGPLREWAQDLLSESRLGHQGPLELAPARAALGEHLSGQRDRTQQIWNVLMFQAWLAAATPRSGAGGVPARAGRPAAVNRA